MVGDTSDYVKLVALVRKKVRSDARAPWGAINPLWRHAPAEASGRGAVAVHPRLSFRPGGLWGGPGRRRADLQLPCTSSADAERLFPSQFVLTYPRSQNVTKGRVVQCVKDGAQSVADVKSKTKAGSGCGGCAYSPRKGTLERQLSLTPCHFAGVPLLTNIVKVRRGALSCGVLRDPNSDVVFSRLS